MTQSTARGGAKRTSGRPGSRRDTTAARGSRAASTVPASTGSATTMPATQVPRDGEASAGRGHERHGVAVPLLVPEVHVHHVTVPAGTPHVPLPHVSTGGALWVGGLAALATVGVIGWPVAAVVAAGTYVAARRARTDVRRELEEQRHEQGTAGGNRRDG